MSSMLGRLGAVGGQPLWLLVIAASASAGAASGAVLGEPPKQPAVDGRYIFYLHGRIIEEQGRRPTHPRWGVYEYDAVLAALAGEGATVLSEARRRGTRVPAYAARIAAQLQRLLDAGVPSRHIGVVGFSKGGVIARAVSARVRTPIAYVLLAGCFDDPTSGMHGRVLSLRERSDTVASSCAESFARSAALTESNEVVLELGGEHGAFYRPDPRWLRQVIDWLK